MARIGASIKVVLTKQAHAHIVNTSLKISVETLGGFQLNPEKENGTAETNLGIAVR
jgi:hypothetical protein